MNERNTVTDKDIKALHYLIGEAVCNIQLLEGALSCSITLKSDVTYPHRIPKKEADLFLKKYRSFTLGQAVGAAKEKSIFSDILQSELKDLAKERNWLAHNCLHEYLDEVCTLPDKFEFFDRIKSIANKAKSLQLAIENDLVEFSESVGLDMSKVREVIALQIKSSQESNLK